MTWRLSRAQFDAQKGAGNKRAFKKLVARGRPPGVLAYAGKQPVGWCAVAPREDYPALERSRVLAPVDDKVVWSVSCFFIARDFRRQGVSVPLLQAAVKFAKSQGAKIVEGYPQDLGKGTLPPPFVWTGLLPTFADAGFKEVARRSAKRPVMRV